MEAVVTNTNGSLPTMGLINLASSFVSFDLDSRIISLSGTPISIATRAIISALETGSKTPPPDKRSFAPGYFYRFEFLPSALPANFYLSGLSVVIQV